MGEPDAGYVPAGVDGGPGDVKVVRARTEEKP